MNRNRFCPARQALDTSCKRGYDFCMTRLVKDLRQNFAKERRGVRSRAQTRLSAIEREETAQLQSADNGSVGIVRRKFQAQKLAVRHQMRSKISELHVREEEKASKLRTEKKLNALERKRAKAREYYRARTSTEAGRQHVRRLARLRKQRLKRLQELGRRYEKLMEQAQSEEHICPECAERHFPAVSPPATQEA